MAKRVVALVMAVVMTLSTVNLTWADPVGPAAPTKTAGQLLAENYAGLSAKETALLNAGYLAEDTYTYTAPDANNGDGKVTIDADRKIVTAAVYTSGGQTWTPVSAEVMVGGTSEEGVVLIDNGSGAYAGTFDYVGTSYSIKVRYKMYITLATATQQTLLDAAGDLLGAANAVKQASDGVSTLEELLGTEIKCNLDDMMQNLSSPSTQPANPLYAVFAKVNGCDGHGIPVGVTGMSISVFGSGSAEDVESGGKLKVLTDDYKADSKLDVAAQLGTFQNGGTIEGMGALCSSGSVDLQSAVAATHEQTALVQSAIVTLENGYTMFGKPVPEDMERAFGLGNTVLTGIQNDLTPCKDYDWSKLTGLVKPALDATASAGLDTMVNGLTAGDITGTAASSESLLADTTEVTASVAQGTINVVIKADVYGDGATATTTLSQNVGTERMAAGTSQSDAMAAIDADASMEAAQVAGWNAAVNGFSYDIDTTHYTRSTAIEPAVSAAGLEDGVTYTYTVTYTPKTYSVTGGTELDNTYDYGYTLTLPPYAAADKVYDYTVNGVQHDQSEKIRVTGITTITRVEGKAWDKYGLGKLIGDNYAAGDTVAQGILPSAALRTGSIRLRTPTADANLLSIAPAAGGYTVTAEAYKANTTALYWVPVTAVCIKDSAPVGTPVSFVRTGATNTYTAAVSGAFDSVQVTYELQLAWTDMAAAPSAASATDILNLPYVLASDAARQLSAMNSLSGQYGTLGEVGSKMNLIRSTIKGGEGVLESTKTAVDNLYNACFDKDGTKQLYIYNYLTQYRACATDGEKLAYYYKNQSALRAQVDTICESLDTILADPAVETLIKDTPETAEYYDKMDEVTDKFNDLRADMVAPNAAIDTASAELTALCTLVAAARDRATQHGIVAAAPKLTNSALSVDAPDKLTVAIEVTVNGSDGDVKSTATRSVTFDADALTGKHTVTAADVTALENARGEAMTAAGVDTVHYQIETADTMPAQHDDISAAVTIRITYEPKEYTVKYTQGGAPVSGLGDVTFPFDNPTVALPASAEAGFRYDYTVNGAVVNDTSYTFTPAQIDALFVGGVYTIDRTRVDMGRENVLKMVDKLNQAALNRGFTYADAGKTCLSASFVPVEKAGQLSIVLRVSPTGLTTEMVTDLLADLMQELMTFSDVKMDGSVLYDGDKLHLQTIADVLLNSGFGMDTLLGAIDASGNINEMTDLAGCTYPTANAHNEIVVGGSYVTRLDELGAKLLASQLTLDGTAAKLYITLEDFDKSAEALSDLRQSIADIQPNLDAELSGGKINVAINAPDSVYQVFLAALLVLGENDLGDVAGFQLPDVETRLFELIKPVLMDPSVTGATIKNTLAKMGVTTNVAKYTDLYDKYIGAIRKVLTDASFTNKTGDKESVAMDVTYDVNGLISGIGGSLSTVVSSLIAEDTLHGSLALTFKGVTAISAYQAMVVSTEGVKFVQDLAGYTVSQNNAVVVVLTNVSGSALKITGDNVLLDLHGNTLNCPVTCTGSRNVIVDSTLNSACTGKVTANVTGAVITAGSYSWDVSGMLKPGYSAAYNASSGLYVVSNDLYTISKVGDVTNLTIKAEMNTARTLTRSTLTAVAAELASDVVLSYYSTMQSLTVGGNAIYTLSIDDATRLFQGGSFNVSNTVGNDLIDDIFNCAGATALVNDLLDTLTDFGTLANKVGNGTPVASYTLDSSKWDVSIATASDIDYLKVGVTNNASSTPAQRTLNVYVNSTDPDDNANLKGVLQEMDKLITRLDVQATLTDVSLPSSLGGKTVQFQISGGGEVYIDLSTDSYAVLTALTAANALPAGALRTELATAIDKYYELHDVSYLKTAVEKLTFTQVINGLKSVTASTSFTAMAANIGLGATAREALNTANVDTGMKSYRDALSFMGQVLKGLGVSGNSYTLSGKDAEEPGVYKFNEENITKSFSRTVSSPWAVQADISAPSVKVTLKMFNEDRDVVVKNTDTGEYIYNAADTDLTQAFAKANSIDKSTVVFHKNSHALAANQNIAKDVIITTDTGASFSLNGYKFVLTDKDAAITMDGITLSDVTKGSGLDAYYLVLTGSTVSLRHYAVGVVSGSTETYSNEIPASLTGVAALNIYGSVRLDKAVSVDHPVAVNAVAGYTGALTDGTGGKFVLTAGGSLTNGLVSGSDPWGFTVEAVDGYYVNKPATNRAECKICPAQVNAVYYNTWAEAAGHINDNTGNALTVRENAPAGTELSVSKNLIVTVDNGVTFTGAFKLTDANATVQATGVTLSATNVKSGVAGYAVSIDAASNKASLKAAFVKLTLSGSSDTYYGTFEQALAASGGKNCTIEVLQNVTLTQDAQIDAYVVLAGADKLDCGTKVFKLTKLGVLKADLGTLAAGADVSVTDLGGGWWRYYNNTVTVTAPGTFAVYESNTDTYYASIEAAIAGAKAADKAANITVVAPLTIAAGSIVDVAGQVTITRQSNMTVGAGTTFRLTAAGAKLTVDSPVTVQCSVGGYRLSSTTSGGKTVYSLTEIGGGGGDGGGGGGGGFTPTPSVPSGNVSGSYIYLDVKPGGITSTQLQTILRKVFNSTGLTVTVNSGLTSGGLVANGAAVTVSGSGSDGGYTIIIMGDTNCNGKTDAGDAVKMRNHYFGTATLSGVSLMAADMNLNGKVDAGDAVKNRIKYQGWSSYKSTLKVTA